MKTVALSNLARSVEEPETHYSFIVSKLNTCNSCFEKFTLPY